MAETQSTNLQLDLVDGDSPFDTDKVKSNFEKIDNAVGELSEKFSNKIKLSDGGYIEIRPFFGDNNTVYVDLMKDSQNGVIIVFSNSMIGYVKVENGVQTWVWQK